MKTLYVTDNGMALKKVSDRIAVKKMGKIIEEIPILDLKRILIFGNSQVSTALLRHLSQKGIEVAFLSTWGRFHFRMVPDTSKNIYLRMAQHRYYDNREFRLEWAANIVKSKILNQKNFILRAQKNQKDKDLSETVNRLNRSIGNLKDKETIEEIMGVEGYAASVYFKAFGSLIRKDFTFTKRAFYPPPDPVNALLSFGYMLVYNELTSLLEAAGFDIFLGFLHSTKYGRASLATDLLEEFRSPVVDRLVLYLINLRVIQPDHFGPVTDKGIRMDDYAKKAYLKNYEKFMTTPFVDYSSRERKNFRQILRDNVLQVERCLLSNEKYKPFVFYA